MRRPLFFAATWFAIALALVIALLVVRLGWLAHFERVVEGDFHQGSGALLELDLLEGAEVMFELCSEDRMPLSRWNGGGRVVIERSDGTPMFDAPIDSEMLRFAKRSRTGACVVFAQVESLRLEAPEVEAAIRIDLVPTLADVPIRARVLMGVALARVDRGLVFGCWILSFVLLMSLSAIHPHRTALRDTGEHDGPRLVVGLVLALSTWWLLRLVTPPGSAPAFVSGTLFVIVEIIAAFALIRPPVGVSHLEALGIERPDTRHGAIGLICAPFVAYALHQVAHMSLGSIESTGEAPIESFVRHPSGLLSFAALAMIAPLGEEMFFRGFVFGALKGASGKNWRVLFAAFGAWLLFVLWHLPQIWGAWGGALSIISAGLGFTVLRAASRSNLAATVAHLLYNGMFAASALGVW